MKRIVIFLIGIYFISVIGAWVLFSKNIGTNAVLANELATTKNMLASEKATRTSLDKKISDARASAEFLSLALCPTIETSKDALCVKNSNEWFSQTIQKGGTLPDTETKTKVGLLLSSLNSKKQPTAKEFYELLKPVEISSLKALTENLK